MNEEKTGIVMLCHRKWTWDSTRPLQRELPGTGLITQVNKEAVAKASKATCRFYYFA